MHVGVGLLVLAMLLTPAVDGVAKTLSAEHSPMMIAFLRYLAAGLMALAVARGSGRTIVVPEGDRVGQLVRTALIMGAMTALIAALGMVPMAKAVGGFLIAPIVSGLLGILVWREPPTATRAGRLGDQLHGRRDAGAAGGGARARVRLCTARRGAARRVPRRHAGRRDHTDALSTLAVQSLLGAALIAPFALAGGLPALTPALVVGAFALGAIRAVCHFLTVAAYQRAEATCSPVPLLQPVRRDGRRVRLVRRDAGAPASVLGLLAIATGGLVALIAPDRIALALPLPFVPRLRNA